MYHKSMKKFIFKMLLITFGAFLAAFAIEGFLVPNQVIDGGIVGISMMISYLTNINLGILLFVLNVPFILLALKIYGKMFIFQTFYAVTVFSIFVGIVGGKIGIVTHDGLLVAVFGGMILGAGVGLVLRNNGSLDGTEILAITLTKKFPVSVGEIIMFVNIFIYTCAGFVYGWDKAMYSTLTYFTASRVIDVVLQGLNEAKSIFVVSDKNYEIGANIMSQLDKSVTYIDAQGGYSHKDKKMLYCVVPRIELTKLKDIVNSIDPEAFIAIENVHEVDGKRVKKY
ncbi:TPA: YitT family protein [Candidatus Galligastranaerophilus intestinavium]|uniref:YitT family protein n=1 Tax=Candidatus Galligastranaerophilus intestinavium TaxID=2840836 RepID=A0A9D1FH43_9BACT|nr:YitT family protein [Candidatus Galligastranaerophilus intestinavium]